MKRTIEIDLVYQPMIEGPPPRMGNLHEKASTGDNLTCDKWREIWIKNYEFADKRFGDFGPLSIGKLYASNRYKPAIIIGSGPSLKESIKGLQLNKKLEVPLVTISCLHNYGYLQDENCHADYYLSLDSGSVVIEDVSESRVKKPRSYWKSTKDSILLASVASDPLLFEKWKGKIVLFNSLIPDAVVKNRYEEIQPFHHYVSSGGNALGACLYVAKAIFGSDPIHMVGADFCFDYGGEFHSYKTHYDEPGQCVYWPSCFGIQRKTWPSYLNFKFWFDHIACNVPGRYINCSEGLLGSYSEGNIRQFSYMSLEDALIPYRMTEKVGLEIVGEPEKGIQDLYLKDLFSDSRFKQDVIIF